MWHNGSLRFECVRGCGNCCTAASDGDHIRLVGSDLADLAGHLGLAPDEFRRRFTFHADGFLAIVAKGSCPFLRENSCTVYNVRPQQCRTFPFWDEILESKESWDCVAQLCPGINRGPLREVKESE